MPIIEESKCPSDSHPPLYANLEDPSMPMRRSVYNKKNSRCKHRTAAPPPNIVRVGFDRPETGLWVESVRDTKTTTMETLAPNDKSKEVLTMSASRDNNV